MRHGSVIVWFGLWKNEHNGGAQAAAFDTPASISAAFCSTSFTIWSTISSVLNVVIGHSGQIDHMLACAASCQTSRSVSARFARAIDDTSQDGERKRCVNMLQPLLKLLHGADYIKSLPGTGWAEVTRSGLRASVRPRTWRISYPTLTSSSGPKVGDIDGVPDPRPEQVADANRGFDSAADKASGLGDTEMQIPA